MSVLAVVSVVGLIYGYTESKIVIRRQLDACENKRVVGTAMSPASGTLFYTLECEDGTFVTTSLSPEEW